MTARYRIKGWHEFQHFRDRSPPWIKLYRKLLDDPDWGELSGEHAKTLVMLWLIASESGAHDGCLPDERRLAYRLRLTAQQLTRHLSALSHYLIRDDIAPISPRYRDDTPETETERETETETDSRAQAREAVSVLPSDFDRFWASYPRKVGKDAARKAWHARKKELPPIADILAAVDAQRRSDAWQKDGGQFIPHPATWLRQGRWADEVIVAGQPAQQQPTAVSPELSERLFLEARRAADKKHGIVREGAQ